MAAHEPRWRGRTVRRTAPDKGVPVMKRFASLIVLLAGAAWVASVFVLDYPSKFQATEHVTDAFRTTFSDAGEKQAADDIATVNAFATDFQGKAAPALAQQLNLTGDQFTTTIATKFPAVGKGLQTLPEALPYFNDLAKTLADQQGNFQRVDDIPTSSLPATATPWLFLVPGVIAILIGFWGLVTRRGRVLLFVSALVGALVIAGTVFAKVPDKTKSADELTKAFRPVFTQETVDKGNDYLTTMTQMGDQLSQQAIPAIAQMLGVSSTQFALGIAQQFPTVATGLTSMPDIIKRMQALLDNIEAHIGDFTKTDEIPTADMSPTWVDWQYWVPAGFLVLFGLIGAFAPHKKPKTPPEAPEAAPAPVPAAP